VEWTADPIPALTTGPGRLIAELLDLAQAERDAGHLGQDARYTAAAHQLNATINSLGYEHAGRSVAFDDARRLYLRANPGTEPSLVDASWL